MSLMFYDAESFNGDVSSWDTSQATDMSSMFEGAGSFNGYLSTWNTSRVSGMRYMFYKAISFNGNITNWDTNNAVDMSAMFALANSFNIDLSSWNITRVLTTVNMFRSAASFRQNLCPWRSRLGLNTSVTAMFVDSSCPTSIDPLLPCGPFCFVCPDEPLVECPTPPQTPVCWENEFLLKLDLLPDAFPNDTSWQVVRDADGLVILQGDGLEMPKVICLPASECYTFTIYDSYSDGICCSHGNGEYSIYIDGELIASGGNFTTSESVNFGGVECAALPPV